MERWEEEERVREGGDYIYLHVHLPLVMLSSPNTICSATLPPMATSSLAMSCFLLHDSSSFSDSIDTIPRAAPLGMMVALWMGVASGRREVGREGREGGRKGERERERERERVYA